MPPSRPSRPSGTSPEHGSSPSGTSFRTARRNGPARPTLSRDWAGLAAFEKPFLTAFAEHGDTTPAFEQVIQTHIPGAKGWGHVTAPDAGHFAQEQQPDLLVDAILSLV